jgi:5-(carboxyamino)imidazole ribonucleotide synthase
VAAEVCAAFTQAAWDDAEAMRAFAADCAVVTYEFENVPVGPLAAIAPTPLLAPPRALEVAQDRVSEKSMVRDLGGTPPLRHRGQPRRSGSRHGRDRHPGILKTRRDGYDGKGQWRIMTPEDAATIDLPDVPLIYEGFVRFSASSR